MMKYIKTFEKLNNKGYWVETDRVFENWANWVNEDDKNKKMRYVNDVIEKLTGHFGVNKKFNSRSLTKIIEQIFDKTMANTYGHNIQVDQKTLNTICRQMEVEKEDGDFIDEDVNIIINILDTEFSGE